MPIQYIRTSNGVEHKIKWAWYVDSDLCLSFSPIMSTLLYVQATMTPSTAHSFGLRYIYSAGCINGHRSKGCDHFSQWMIQVGLPGRPKAKCPHVEPPCTCKTKERYLMVSIGTSKNALLQVSDYPPTTHG